MLEMRRSRDSSAPPAQVFAVATDLRNAVGRVRVITKLDVSTPGPVGNGTRFRETCRMFGREATEEMEITAFDPLRFFTMECANHCCHHTSAFRFAPHGAGTEMEIRFQARPREFGAKWMGILIRPPAKKRVASCSQDLEDIARVAEGQAG
ncbi:MAG: SRPBCC family protein [Planctomycetota bacterium]|nr:SRPBCC family protein [Planctomycetota bacterium]